MATTSKSSHSYLAKFKKLILRILRNLTKNFSPFPVSSNANENFGNSPVPNRNCLSVCLSMQPSKIYSNSLQRSLAFMPRACFVPVWNDHVASGDAALVGAVAAAVAARSAAWRRPDRRQATTHTNLYWTFHCCLETGTRRNILHGAQWNEIKNEKTLATRGSLITTLAMNTTQEDTRVWEKNWLRVEWAWFKEWQGLGAADEKMPSNV